MKNQEQDEWDGFELFRSEKGSATRKLFDSYLEMKSHFSNLPKSELLERGWISSRNDLSQLTDFYSEIQEQNGGSLFRRNESANSSLSLLWLSKVRTAAKIKLLTSELSDFCGVEKKDLNEIARLSQNPEIIKDLDRVLEKKGIILVFCNALPRMNLDGAAFKLESGHPVVGLSLRFGRVDNFWFTLMHELAHICLHIDFLNTPIVDDLESESESESEIEIAANRLAKQAFVDRKVWRNCAPKYDRSIETLTSFAKSIEIHPAIVAGLIRKETGDYTLYNQLIHEIDVREIISNAS